jgi:uncharacterized protein YjbI with pentapeptide repeats
MYNNFYLSEQKGSDCSHINSTEMQQFAQNSIPISTEEFRNIVMEHHLFLASGGMGGSWRMLSVTGTVIGVYASRISDTQGRQAHLDMKNLSLLGLQEVDLPFSSWVGAFARYQDFSDADLHSSIFCDAFLANCIFADANLEKVDFSRAHLRKVSFMNANLKNADFENCDLTGADFRGAILDGAIFKGAILEGVWR